MGEEQATPRTLVPRMHPESPRASCEKLFLFSSDVTGKAIAARYFDMYEGGKKTLFLFKFK